MEKTQNFCQLLSRQAAGPARGEAGGWGQWGPTVWPSPFQTGGTRPYPKPQEDREVLVPGPGAPGSAPPGPPCPPPLHLPSPAGGRQARQPRPEAAPTGSDFRFGLDLARGLGPAPAPRGLVGEG